MGDVGFPYELLIAMVELPTAWENLPGHYARDFFHLWVRTPDQTPEAVAAAPLRAEFRNVPKRHDDQGSFTVVLAFQVAGTSRSRCRARRRAR